MTEINVLAAIKVSHYAHFQVPIISCRCLEENVDMPCCSVFCNHGGGAGGGEFVVVTSQLYGSPNSLFEGTVSEYELCAFLLYTSSKPVL